LADKKITQLTNITGANLADADEFVVVDITADETKAITFSEFRNALDTATGFVRITGDTMTGDLTVPTVIGNVTGNVTGTVSSLSNHDTGDLSEGSNLYYTTARFDTRLGTKSTSDLSEGSNLYYTTARFDTRLGTKSTSDLSEGSNLYYTDARVDARVPSVITSTVDQAFVNNLNVDAETLDGDTKATILSTAESNSLALSIALG